MKSMTGYATLTHSSVWSECEITIKTVNGRFFELRCHLPKEAAILEPQIRRMLQRRIRRGTVELTLSRRPRVRALVSRIEIKSDLAKQWIASFKRLQTELSGVSIKGVRGKKNAKNKTSREDNELSPVDLMVKSLNVLQVEEKYPMRSEEISLLDRALKKAAAQLDVARLAEGRALRLDIVSQIRQLNHLTVRISKAAKESMPQMRRKLQERLRQVSKQFQVDEGRAIQEIALLVEKGDVNEELVRIRQHVSSVARLLKAKEPVGKKLDFFMQELLREVNTIGSKAQSAELTALVVDAKTVIERLREQVQNIE